jgi:hypothetical protein
MDRLLEGAKRIAAERWKPVKKSTEVKLEVLRKAITCILHHTLIKFTEQTCLN